MTNTWQGRRQSLGSSLHPPPHYCHSVGSLDLRSTLFRADISYLDPRFHHSLDGLNADLIPLLLFSPRVFYLLSCGELIIRNVADFAPSLLSSSSDLIRWGLAAGPQRRDGDKLDSVAHHIVFRHRQTVDPRLDTEGGHAFTREPYFEARSG